MHSCTEAQYIPFIHSPCYLAIWSPSSTSIQNPAELNPNPFHEVEVVWPHFAQSLINTHFICYSLVAMSLTWGSLITRAIRNDCAVPSDLRPLLLDPIAVISVAHFIFVVTRSQDHHSFPFFILSMSSDIELTKMWSPLVNSQSINITCLIFLNNCDMHIALQTLTKYIFHSNCWSLFL